MTENNLIVFYGEDVPGVYALKDRYLRTRKKEETKRFTENVNATLVLHEIGTQSLFTQQRTLEFINPLFFTSADANADDMITKLKELSDDTRVVFIVEGSLDRRRKIVRSILNMGTSYEAKFIPRWKIMDAMLAYLAKQNYKITPDAQRYLREITESWEAVSSVFIETECNKWILMETNDVITLNTILNSLPSYLNQEVFSFWDKLLSKNPDVLSTSDGLFETNDELKNIGYITSQLRLCIAAQELLDAGIVFSEIQSRIGLKGKQYRWRGIVKSLNILDLFSAKRLLLDIYEHQFRLRNSLTGRKYKDIWLKFIEQR